MSYRGLTRCVGPAVSSFVGNVAHYKIPACAGMTGKKEWRSGKQQGQSLKSTYRWLPAPDSAGIDVHKIGFRVVTDATAFHSKRGVTQIAAGNDSEAYIDSFT